LAGKRHKRSLQLNNIVSTANKAFNNLEQLNTWLNKFGVDAQPSITKAVNLLQTIHVNIFDLLQDHFDKRFSTVQDLAAYSASNKKLFPRERAKAEGLRAFLRKLWPFNSIQRKN